MPPTTTVSEQLSFIATLKVDSELRVRKEVRSKLDFPDRCQARKRTAAAPEIVKLDLIRVSCWSSVEAVASAHSLITKHCRRTMTWMLASNQS